MRPLHAKPLTAAGFKPYGALVDSDGRSGVIVNEGRGVRIAIDAALTHQTDAAQPSLAIYRINASEWPAPVNLLERHRRSTQMFLPLQCRAYLVVAAASLPDGSPDLRNMAAFIGAPTQGIVYAPGVWHLPLVALEQPAEFAMLMWEAGDASDCDEYRLAEPVLAYLQSTSEPSGTSL